jgi:hypothetical protein
MLVPVLKSNHNDRFTHAPDDRRPLHLVSRPDAGTRIVIEPVNDSRAEAAAARIRKEVFEREWKIRVPRLQGEAFADSLTLIARIDSQPEPVAVVTVIETTGDHELHGRFGLDFPEDTRVARYTQLAVLKPWRGLNIPIQLVAEARRRFVIPEGIHYTWLLFNADRARSSSFCSELGFHSGGDAFDTEYGRSRVLLRSERVLSLNAIRTPEVLTPDEWVAQ